MKMKWKIGNMKNAIFRTLNKKSKYFDASGVKYLVVLISTQFFFLFC